MERYGLSNPTGSAGGGSQGNGLINIPPRPNRTASNNRAPAPQVNPEEQAALMEVTRELNRDKINRGEFPPLPPTILSGPQGEQ